MVEKIVRIPDTKADLEWPFPVGTRLTYSGTEEIRPGYDHEWEATGTIVRHATQTSPKNYHITWGVWEVSAPLSFVVVTNDGDDPKTGHMVFEQDVVSVET